MSREDGRIEIGAALRDARRRYGMEVREVEERTKIRAKYIRALENEDWATLPAPAYVRGFLRTYGQMLGLDGEMLVDEYRRRYGDAEAAAGLLTDMIDAGHDGTLISEEKSGTVLYEIHLGPYADLEEAQRMSDVVRRSHGLSPAVIVVEPVAEE